MGCSWAHRALMQKGFGPKNKRCTIPDLQEGSRQQFKVHKAIHRIGKEILAVVSPSPLREVILVLTILRFASAMYFRIGFGVTYWWWWSLYQLPSHPTTQLQKGGSPGATVLIISFLEHLPNWIVRSQTLMHAREWSWGRSGVFMMSLLLLSGKNL